MLLNNVRLSFPKLFRAEAFQPGQVKKYGATLIVPKDHPQLGEIKAMIADAAAETWGEDWQSVLKSLPSDKKGLRDGSEKANLDGFGSGVMFFNATTDKRPGVYDRDQSPLVEDDGRPYAGCYVNAQIEAWAQNNQYGKRINFTLRGVQFAEDGEAFGGGGAPAAADEFPDLSGAPMAASAASEPDGADDWL